LLGNSPFSRNAQSGCKLFKISAGGRLHGDDARDWNPIFFKKKGGSLIVRPIDTIGEIAGRLGDADDQLSHKIRLADSRESAVRRPGFLNLLLACKLVKQGIEVFQPRVLDDDLAPAAMVLNADL